MAAVSQSHALTWDIFCRVIDNYGDLGVCWRLARELGARGHGVRLWVDDAAMLDWLAPGAQQGRFDHVRVLRWSRPLPTATLSEWPAADVWIEAFGCELPHEFLAAYGRRGTGARPPVWINLEYLSAESFSQRAHGLPSLVTQGPAAGCTKWFFYPGFDAATGGLLREHDLLQRQARFDRRRWLREHVPDVMDGRLISLFCYEPPALPALLGQLQQTSDAWQLLVTAGRATEAVRAWQGRAGLQRQALRAAYLPLLPQTGFDELLWACDLNFVRGEDSLVRALWAGKPFVWQPYPQQDGVHVVKLAAFLDWLQPPQAVRILHQAWSGVAGVPLPALAQLDWAAWAACVRMARERLLAQADLATRLLDFVMQKR